MGTRLMVGAASVAFVLVLGLPAAAMATPGSYSHVVIKDLCSNSGGAFGYGKNALTIEMDEHGTSGVAQFHARASEQEYSSGAWQTIHEWPWAATSFFEDNARSHSWTYGKRYDLGAATSNRHRLVIKIVYGNGTAYPTYTKKVFGQAC